MKHVSLIVPIAAFFVILFIYTKFFGPIPFTLNSVTTTKEDTFRVSGEGKVFVKPDTAYVTAGIQVNGNSVKQAQDEINKVINQVSQAVKDLGVDAENIQTTNYNINPNYDFTSGRQNITGYSASTNLRIKVKETEKINGVIDAATKGGANQVSGVDFEVENKNKAENEARQKAVSDAKKKAEEASKIAGFRLGRIINYAEDFGGIRPPEVFRTQTMEAKTADTQIEPGSSEIQVTVNLSYEIL